MKKFSKILIPILVLSLLVGLFAVIAMADDTAYNQDVKTEYSLSSLTNSFSSLGEDTVAEKDYVAYDGTTVNYIEIADGDAKDEGAYINLPDTGPSAHFSVDQNKMVRDYYYAVWSFDVTSTSKTWHSKGFRFFGKYAPINLSDGVAGAATWGNWGTSSTWTPVGIENDDPFTWHNVTLIIDYSTGVINFYLDGALFRSYDLYDESTVTVYDLSDNRFQFPTEEGYDYGITNVKTVKVGTPGTFDKLFKNNNATLADCDYDLPYNTAADITPGKAAVSIGGTNYPDFPSAAAAWQPGDVITLNRDVKVEYYFESEAVVDTNGFSINYDVYEEYVAFEEDGILTIRSYEDCWETEMVWPYIIFQHEDGTVISMSEYPLPLGCVVPKAFVPGNINSPVQDYLGWVQGTDVTADLISGGFYATNQVEVPDLDDDGIDDYAVIFTAVPGQSYKNIVAAIQDADGKFVQRFTAEQLADFDTAYASATAGYRYHLLTNYTFTHITYGGTNSTLVIHGVTAKWERGPEHVDKDGKPAGRFFADKTQNTIEGVTVGEARGKFVSVTPDSIIYANDTNNTSLTLKNVDLEVVSVITDMRRGSINLINSSITNTAGGHTLQLWARYQDSVVNLNLVDSTLSSAGVNGTSYIPALRVVPGGSATGVLNISLKGNSVIKTTDENNSNALNIDDSNCVANLYIGKNVALTAGEDNFALKNSNVNLKVTIEEGFAHATGALQNVNDQNLLLAGGGTGYWREVGENFVWSKAGKTVTLNFVVNGVTTPYVLVNDATDYVTPDTPSYYVQDGETWYKYNFSHWATVEGGSVAATIDPSTDGTYYAVYAKGEAATKVGYVTDANDVLIEEFFNPDAFDDAFKANKVVGAKFHLLTDFEFKSAGYFSVSAELIIHGGVTTDWTNTDNIGNTRFLASGGTGVIKGITENDKRPTFNMSYGWELIMTGTLTVENLDIVNPNKISDFRGGYFKIDNCSVTVEKQHAVQIYGAGTLVINDSNIVCNDSRGNIYALYIIGNDGNNPQITLSGNTVIKDHDDKNYSVNIVTGKATLMVGKDVSIYAKDGWGIRTVDKAVVKFEEGFTASAAPQAADVSDVVSGSFSNLEGDPGFFEYVEGTGYVFTKADTVVTLNFNVDGTVTTVKLMNGNESYAAPATAQTYSVNEGVITVTTFSHWAKEANGEAVDVDPTKDGTYYAVFKSVSADWVVYDANDAILNAGADTMPAVAINASGAAKVVLKGDVTLDISVEVYCANNVTFELGGFTLTTGGVQRYTLNGKTVTFKNGTLVKDKDHTANFFYGSGNLYFVEVTLDVYNRVVDFRSNGIISLTDCVVNQYMNTDCVFSLGGDAERTNFEAINTVVNITDTKAEDNAHPWFLQTSSMDRTSWGDGYGQQPVYSTITLDNTVVNGGEGNAFRMSDQAGEGSLVNIYLKNNTKIYTVLTTICSGGVDALETVIHLDQTVVISKTATPVGGRFSLPEGKVLAYDAENEVYAVVDFVAPTDVRANLTLYTDINFNFFVPVSYGDNYTFAINGAPVATSHSIINGKNYYRISVESIRVYQAAEGEFVLTLTSVNGTAVEATLATSSVLDYVEKALALDLGVTAKTLIANVVDYVAAAYAYDTNGDALPEALATVIASEDYLAAAAAYNRGEIGASNANAAGAAGAIASVQLNITSGFKYRLNLVSTYTGTLTVNGEAYDVKNGMVDGNAYIEVTVLACDMLIKNITVVDDENAIDGSFDLEYYMAQVKDVELDKGDLDELLEALYYYCEAAAKYEALVDR